MKSVGHWVKPLAMLTLTFLAWVDPTPRMQASATDLRLDFEPIQIDVPPPESKGKGGVCPDFLGFFIDSIISRPAVARGNWGILVESLSNDTVFYSHNASRSFIPASNTKLLTTAAALQKLDQNAKIGTTPLAEWIRVTNTNSNNAYADTLMRRLGGLSAAKEALTQLGVNPSSYRISDGSGLSRQNLATPTALVETLKAMNIAKGREVFYTSLAVGGVSGTLRNRFRLTPAQGKLHAKTGTLRGVSALSGYLENPNYGTLVFSIIVNQPGQPDQAFVGAIDEIVLQLSRLTSCQ
ncbi:MAG TPA: D-alanyl-D-alanine carboxypeptidase/D-alanyl-D-alanine-endopeptidase [Cyanobacteria bacterium UBA8803]|nr:D-alanyl-D-alanine carboxypeptidase/D-alanyl-D-alanine-endopeptidase [Cyanobacteria bacterium UBA9273]HBL58112.1 D-alanyl-D-alanine carboxypeptidase/D-alanyl-D-alanine-endopeptidase [Cyanobacteria bacterium UBA8803]